MDGKEIEVGPAERVVRDALLRGSISDWNAGDGRMFEAYLEDAARLVVEALRSGGFLHSGVSREGTTR